MSQAGAAPEDLSAWIEERARLLTSIAAEIKSISARDRDDRAAWTMNLLEETAELETHARRMVHLLTAYALRERLASPTVVAKRSKVTITAAQNRAGSSLASEVWSELWPSSQP